MARVTIEGCLPNINESNRFELVELATKRTRQLSHPKISPLVTIDNDKNTVIALREIEDGLVSAENLIALKHPEKPAEPVAEPPPPTITIEAQNPSEPAAPSILSSTTEDGMPAFVLHAPPTEDEPTSE